MQTIKLAYKNPLPLHKIELEALLSLKTGESLTSMLVSLIKYLKTFDDLGEYAHINPYPMGDGNGPGYSRIEQEGMTWIL